MLYIYNTKNHDSWELTCENHPWKLTVQNFVRIADPGNHLIEIFFNSENWGNSQNLPSKLKPTVLTKEWEPLNTGFFFSLLFFWWFWSNLRHLWHPQIKLDWQRAFCFFHQQMRFTTLLFVFYCNKCMTGLCQRAWKAMRKWGGGIT